MAERSFDALVLGAGAIGLLAARELRRAGLQVAVLERDQPGRQASWASAGIVHGPEPWATDPYSQLHNLSASLFPRLSAELQDETSIDVEYRENGWIVPACTEEEAGWLADNAEQLRRAGVDSEVVSGRALQEAEPALGGRVIAGQLLPGGNVENRRLVRALEVAEERAGTPIVSGAAVTEVLQSNGKVIGVRTVLGTEFATPVVVVAAGSWSGQIAGIDPRVPIVPQRGQILALSNVGVGIRRVVMTPNDPYLVPRADGRLVVGATREFVGYDSRLTAGGVNWLLQSAADPAPGLANAPIVEMWTGFRPMSPDGLPVIGEGSLAGLFFATGHGPSGIGPAPATAQVLAALVLRRPSPVAAELFSPLRFA